MIVLLGSGWKEVSQTGININKSEEANTSKPQSAKIRPKIFLIRFMQKIIKPSQSDRYRA